MLSSVQGVSSQYQAYQLQSQAPPPGNKAASPSSTQQDTVNISESAKQAVADNSRGAAAPSGDHDGDGH
ncbi:MAG TPA: hypothetical protein VMV31_11165 [Terriglobales bacterium]|nr:hypothetical protein [Terriglobales bacterium]